MSKKRVTLLNLLRRFWVAWHALRGHGVMYMVRMENGAIVLDGPAVVVDCAFHNGLEVKRREP